MRNNSKPGIEQLYKNSSKPGIEQLNNSKPGIEQLYKTVIQRTAIHKPEIAGKHSEKRKKQQSTETKRIVNTKIQVT